MDNNKITSIGRPLDKNYKTNRIISIISMLTLIVGFLYKLSSELNIVDSLLWSLGAGLTVFLTWALGREIDPDHDASAFIGTGLSVAGLVVFALPDFIAIFWFLLASRIINRTTGLPAKFQDSVIVLLLGGWLLFQGNWGFGLATIFLFVLDSKAEPKNKKQWIFAALTAITTALLLNQVIWIKGFEWSHEWWIALIISLLFIPFVYSSKQVTSKGDATNEPLRADRVQSAQLLVMLLAIQTTLWDSKNGFEDVMPLWAAMGGASLRQLSRLAKK